MTPRKGLLLAVGLAVAGAGCVHRAAEGTGVAAKPDGGVAGVPVPETLAEKPSAALCLNMAEALERDGREADAVPYYEKARQLDPAQGERVGHRLAILYDRLDDQAGALKEFNELLRKRPKDSGLLNDVGYSYYNRGDWAAAEAHLRRAVAADKSNKRAWVNLGLALAQQGKEAEAVDAFGKAVTPAEAQVNLGFVLTTQGKRAEAAVAYRRALAFEPTLRSAQAAVARLEAGGPAGQPASELVPAGGGSTPPGS